jgi:AbrB family looped-hinge helix DNA binding protein
MVKNTSAVSSDAQKKSVKTAKFISSNPGSRSHTTKVTAKGQITVPKPIREHLKLAKGDRIEFLIGVNGEVTIMPATADVRKLKGMVAKPSKPVTVEEMNRAIEAEGGRIK